MPRELWQKLGIKEGFKILLVNAPSYYPELLGAFPQNVEILHETAKDLDMIHLFISDEPSLQSLIRSLKELLPKSSMLWISWPKGGSKIPTSIKRDAIREIGLAAGLVDVKVCSVSEDWSGLKFVYRLIDR